MAALMFIKHSVHCSQKSTTTSYPNQKNNMIVSVHPKLIYEDAIINGDVLQRIYLKKRVCNTQIATASKLHSRSIDIAKPRYRIRCMGLNLNFTITLCYTRKLDYLWPECFRYKSSEDSIQLSDPIVPTKVFFIKFSLFEYILDSRCTQAI